MIQIAEETHSGIKIIALYLIIKFIFTCTSFGSGTPGGIFMYLTVGALTGSLLGTIATRFGLLRNIYQICSMRNGSAGSVRHP